MKLFRRMLSLMLVLLLMSGMVLPAGVTAFAAGITVSSISVNTEPTRTGYTVGDKLDLAGLTAKLHYSDDTSLVFAAGEFADKGITVTPAEGTPLTTEGKQKITLSHGDLNASFEVTVGPEKVTVDGFKVNTPPTRTQYTVGDKLDLTGLTAKLHFSDESSFIYTPDQFADKGITVTPAEGTVLNTQGRHKVTISHGELTDSFEIMVEPANSGVTELTVNTEPARTQYTVGDKLDLAGLTAKLRYSDESSNIFTPDEFADKDITVTPANGTLLTTEGIQKVTLSFGNLNASFEITVKGADILVSDLTVNTEPARIEYTVGDKLDLAGLTAKLRYSDESSNIFTPDEFADKDITVTPANGTLLTTEGIQKVTLSHGELKASFEINVLPAEERQIDRIFGSDRYETAIAVSSEGWEQAESVILASGADFADALAGAGLSKALNAPILLVSGKDNAHVYAEIERLGAVNAWILGGENAVSPAVASRLSEMGLNVSRLSGTDRYATAAAIAAQLSKLNGETKKAFVVSGESFADALSAGYASAVTGSPILYTNTGSLNDTTAQYIASAGINEVIIIGGSAAVSDAAAGQLTQLTEVSRIGGEDRYQTSLAMAQAYFDHTNGSRISLATGKDFPDALTGGAYAIKLAMPVLLVGDKADDQLLQYLDDCGISHITIFGGKNAISSDVADALK